MTIYTAPGVGETTTLVARRTDWEVILAAIPERPRGPDRPQLERIRGAIAAALAGAGEVVRVSVAPEEARWVLGRQRIS